MNPAGRNGLMVGILVGGLAAWLTWDGRIIAAGAAIAFASAIGWFVGYFLGDKRAR